MADPDLNLSAQTRRVLSDNSRRNVLIRPPVESTVGPHFCRGDSYSDAWPASDWTFSRKKLQVVLRTTSSDSGGRFEVALLDTLDNGAGYARHLAEPQHLRELLLKPAGSSGVMAQHLTRHTEQCDGSCYDCLRDYGNSPIHGWTGVWVWTWLAWR